jgi:WhiB family transcriptional regulator, redox-sensing transcriptional regulator
VARARGAGRAAAVTAVRRQSWRSRAACKGTDLELFFPPADAGRNAARAAKAICAGCPVKAACLRHALGSPERFGVWAGLAERERRGMKPEASPVPQPRQAVA